MLFMFKQYEKKLFNTFSFTYRSNNRNKVFALIQQNLFFCLMEIFLQPSLQAWQLVHNMCTNTGTFVYACHEGKETKIFILNSGLKLEIKISFKHDDVKTA